MNNRIVTLGFSWSNNTIKSARAMLDTSLNGRTLDVDTFTATVISDDPTVADLDHAQPVQILRGGSQIGVYYPDTVTQIGANQWKIRLVSPLGLLERRGHVGGIYVAKNAKDLIEEICGGVGGVPVIVEEPFASATVNGWLPYVSPADEAGAQEGTAKDNLLQVLFALNASLRADADGTLRVCNLPTSVSSVIDADRIFRGGYEIEYDQPVSDIVLTEHSYYPNTTADREELFSGTAVEGQRVVFPAPMSDLQPAAMVAEAGDNYAILHAGTGTLTGVPYLHIERELTRTVTVGAAKNTVTISDATLIGLLNSSSVMDRLYAYYSHSATISAEVQLLYEKPGDVISIFDKFSGTMLSAAISKISPETFSQTLRGSISALVGYLPWNEGSYEQKKVVLTGSGSFVVPAGVTTLTVILIGGGGGGSCGANGTSAVSCSPHYSNYYGIVGSLYDSYPTGGTGGAAGAGGNPGKVLRVTLPVTPSDSILYDCGLGGDGAAAGGDKETLGDDGTATTFGSLTSDDGYAYPSGYQDPVNGTIYGGNGDAGIAGGNGNGYNSGDAVFAENPSPTIAAPVVYNGVTYYPGANGTRGVWTEQGTVVHDGSLGGGAAAGADGEDGVDGAVTGSQQYAVGGGNGADAVAPPAPVYGRGGCGGNGGGGAGSPGCFWRYVGQTIGIGGVINPAHGGAGSAGGKGGDGCVIVYYRTLNS